MFMIKLVEPPPIIIIIIMKQVSSIEYQLGIRVVRMDDDSWGGKGICLFMMFLIWKRNG